MRLTNKLRYITEEISLIDFMTEEVIDAWEEMVDSDSTMDTRIAMTLGARFYYGFVGLNLHTESKITAQVQDIQEVFMSFQGKEVTEELIEEIIEQIVEDFSDD